MHIIKLNNYDMHMRENDRFIDRMHITILLHLMQIRGQGKRQSALYTFAQYLNNCCSTEDVYFKTDRLMRKLRNEFEILSIIDQLN